MTDWNTHALRPLQGDGRKLFIETYGCQMNVSDTEVVVAVMQREGYVYTDRIDEADVVLLNTCSIRDNAEQRIWGRLAEMKRYRRERPGLVIGIIGCMAERLREQLVEGPNAVDVVAGPDAYRDLPRLVREAEAGGKGIHSGMSAATIQLGKEGIIHGARTLVMQNEDGQIEEPYSVSAGLDYPGIGPIHANLSVEHRAQILAVDDDEALEAAFELTRLEGIIPALESAHALGALAKVNFKPEDVVVLTVSGRGDKDMDTYINYKLS